MIGWFLTTRLGRGVAAALLTGAVLFGWLKRGQHEATKALKSYKRTRKEMDDVPDFGNDPAAADRLLRERQRKRGL